MEITLKSEIERHGIKLPEWVNIPDGTKVKVRIETETTKEEKRNLAEELCGSWAGDQTIDAIFEEIEKERHSYLGRKVNFDVSVDRRFCG